MNEFSTEIYLPLTGSNSLGKEKISQNGGLPRKFRVYFPTRKLAKSQIAILSLWRTYFGWETETVIWGFQGSCM